MPCVAPAGAMVYSSELLLNGIVTQKLEYQRFVIVVIIIVFMLVLLMNFNLSTGKLGTMLSNFNGHKSHNTTMHEFLRFFIPNA